MGCIKDYEAAKSLLNPAALHMAEFK
jgi:hypothetical protein